MTTNFRKAYYSSLGVKTVEVKPSVENVLQGKFLSIDRLNKLCLWIRIPHFYRPVVWKLLLGVTSVHKEAWSFIAQQRQEHFEDLKEAVFLLTGKSIDGMDDDLTPLLLAQMVLLELTHDTPHTVTQASTFVLIRDDASDHDAFWICLHFIKKLRIDIFEVPEVNSESCIPSNTHVSSASTANYRYGAGAYTAHLQSTAPEKTLLVPAGQAFTNDIKSDIETLIHLLGLHNAGLLEHIRRLGVSLHEACRGWFQCCFANVISSHAIEGVWDIVIGGAPGILPYLGLCLLLCSGRKIEACRSSQEFILLISQIEKFVDVDSVANMSIDLWEIPVLECMTKETRRLLGYRF
ncbi:hypothetical protein BSLG_000474 [Batrachochytrium salamandrivorans]|nr:hypothetical protein BSLG_000474 [Batrachochytrium salamandrivorans]